MTDPTTHHPPDIYANPLTPTAITHRADLEPAARESMVWVPGPGGDFIAVPRSLLPADYFTPPAPVPAPAPAPAFRPGIDHRAQILAAGGIGIGAAGWGAGQLVSAFAGLGTAGLLALALIAVAARMPRGAAGAFSGQGSSTQGGDHTEIHVHRGGRVKARHVHIR